MRYLAYVQNILEDPGMLKLKVITVAAILTATSIATYAAKGGKPQEPRDFVFSDMATNSSATFDSGPNPDGSWYSVTMGVVTIDDLNFDYIQKLTEWRNLQSPGLHIGCPTETVVWWPIEASRVFMSPKGAIRLETVPAYQDPEDAASRDAALSNPNNPDTSLFCLAQSQDGSSTDVYVVMRARYRGTGEFRCVNETADKIVLLNSAETVFPEIGSAGIAFGTAASSLLTGVTVPASCP